MRKLKLVSLLLISCGVINLNAADDSDIDWQAWSPGVFQTSAQQQRYVLLNLEAVWCHWCHVMDQRTYSDAEVADYLAQNYIAVKVDHDARPDLAERYRNWGWPATVIFAPDGSEIVKRRGFVAPDDFLTLLQAVVANPDPHSVEVSAPAVAVERDGKLSDELRGRLLSRHQSVYDEKLGGMPFGKKSLPGDAVEWMLVQSVDDPQQAERARQTLDGASQLIDPVWGGVYQYSTHSDWQHPHYEKINRSQARYLRIYSLAYARFQRPEDLQAAQAVADYLREFLRAENGAYYTSQDADLIQGQKAHDFFALDDQARRTRGIPRIDTHQYARENGTIIEGLAMMYEFAGDQQALNDALAAANWILSNRSLPGGGFMHGANDTAGPFLGDTLAMGRAMLQLYRATGDIEWLGKSAQAADFITDNFKRKDGGLASAADNGTPVKPVPVLDENIKAARYLNLLAHYTGNQQHRELADFVMAWLVTPEVVRSRRTNPGILLAHLEFRRDPQHLTIVGSRADEQWTGLRDVALRQPDWYKRLDTWNPENGPAYNPDITYPQLGQAAGFYCADGRCSLPASEPAAYSKLVADLSKLK